MTFFPQQTSTRLPGLKGHLISRVSGSFFSQCTCSLSCVPWNTVFLYFGGSRACVETHSQAASDHAGVCTVMQTCAENTRLKEARRFGCILKEPTLLREVETCCCHNKHSLLHHSSEPCCAVGGAFLFVPHFHQEKVRPEPLINNSPLYPTGWPPAPSALQQTTASP